MSLHETDRLVDAMLRRAAAYSPYESGFSGYRPSFNPHAGSWVFGLAAFAAGVALNKMIGGNTSAPEEQENKGESQLQALKPQAPAGSQAGSRSRSMKALLRDTMAEESRSGEALSGISAEVAKLREEVAALSAQREHIKQEAHYAEQTSGLDQFSAVRQTLADLNQERVKLTETESNLQKVLAEQRAMGVENSAFQHDLAKVQLELASLQSEQSRIQSEYDHYQREASEARQVMGQLKEMLAEKSEKLLEAERRELELKRDHQILLETVDGLKSQLEFFRSKAAADQSGVTSLKILEDSNEKLVEQVNSSLVETEHQQTALAILQSEKVQLTKQLEEYRALALKSEQRAQELEAALSEAKKTEKTLLAEVNRLSTQQVSDAASIGSSKLEAELASARANIVALEENENLLKHKLALAESTQNQGLEDSRLVTSLESERDGLLVSLREARELLDRKDKNFQELESSLKEHIKHVEQRTGTTKTALVEAAEKEEELNDRIASLLSKISQLEGERDLYRSQSEKLIQTSGQGGNEFKALRQSILTLESEKNALNAELQKYQYEASVAQQRHADAQQKLAASQDQERVLTEELDSIRASMTLAKQTQDGFSGKEKELRLAQQHISQLLEEKAQKEQELDAAIRDKDTLDKKLVELSQRSGLLANEELASSQQLSHIKAELQARDSEMAVARIREEHLQKDAEALQGTIKGLQEEVRRLHSLNANSDASKASVALLAETEEKLKLQLQQAQQQIDYQHQQLLEAQQYKAKLEFAQREESIRLSSLESENKLLREKLDEWQSQERAQAGRLSALTGDIAEFRSLESQHSGLEKKHQDLIYAYQQAQRDEQSLKIDHERTLQQLQALVAERDSLNRELLGTRQELQKVAAERDELRYTCGKLQHTISELEKELAQKDAKHQQELRDLETTIQKKQSGIIPLTSQDALVEERVAGEIKPLPRPQNVRKVDAEQEYEELGELEEIQSADFEDSVPDKKVGRFRKFQGHRDTEDVLASERELDERQQQLDEQMAASQSSFADSTAQDGEERKPSKVHSPNRDFLDLLEDSERRSNERKAVSKETEWDQIDEKAEELEEGSMKPLIWGGAAAGLLLGAAGFYFWEDLNQKNHAGDKPNVVNHNTNNSGDLNGADNSGDGNGSGMTEEARELETKKKLFGLIEQFELSRGNLKDQSSLCRVPNKTLIDMQEYYRNKADDFKTLEVQAFEEVKRTDGVNLIKAQLLLDEGGVEEPKPRMVYFEKVGDEYLLDWYSYVKYEFPSWAQYLNMGDPQPKDWHLMLVGQTQNDHPYYEETHHAIEVRSWNRNSTGKANAYIAKDNPEAQNLLDLIKSNQELIAKSRKRVGPTVILRVSQKEDDPGNLIIEDVISLDQFYAKDTNDEVSSEIDDMSYEDSSY